MELAPLPLEARALRLLRRLEGVALVRGRLVERSPLPEALAAADDQVESLRSMPSDLIEAALAAGSLGAKLAGAGDGGTIVALCRDEQRPAVEAALRQAGAAALYRPAIAPGITLEWD